jgi:hypothetical protein
MARRILSVIGCLQVCPISYPSGAPVYSISWRSNQDFRTPRLRLPRIRIYRSKPLVDSLRHDGGSTCHGRVGGVSCASLWCPARFTSRPRPRARSIRLHQVWRPTPAEEADDAPPLVKGQELPDRSAPRLSEDDSYEEADQTAAATRITLRPYDPSTGEVIKKEEVVKGYEYERGQFVTFTAEKLKALDVEARR